MYRHNNKYVDIPLVLNKYYKLHLNTLRNLANKMEISFHLNTSREDLIYRIIPSTLSNVNFLEKFYSKLLYEEKDIFKYIVFYDDFDLENDVKKKFKYKIVLDKKRQIIKYVWWLELFINNGEFEEYYKELFYSFLTNPNKEKNIIPIVPIEDTISDIKIEKFTINGKSIVQKLKEEKANDLLSDIKIIYELAKNEKIVLIQNGSISKRSEKLLSEILPNNYHYLLNFLIIFDLLKNQKKIIPTKQFIKIINYEDGDLLKAIFDKFYNLQYQYEFRNLDFSTSTKEGTYIIKFRKQIVSIIKALKTSKWINIEYIVSQISFDKTTLKNITNNNRYGYSINQVYNSMYHLETVVRYFIKSFIEILYYMGICNIAITSKPSYTKKDAKLLLGKYGELSAKIEYFQLSDIGNYTLGLSNNFKSKQSYTIRLNSYNLDIVVENSNNISDLFLQNLAIKLADNKYQISIKTFMQNINTANDYANIKKTFLDKCENIPVNWKEFFNILDKRVSFATTVSSSAVVIKLQNYKDILQIISQNSKLNEKILKANNLHIVVLKENISYVKKVFKDYGIIL